MGMSAPVLWIVTEPRLVGKSTFCRAMVKTARNSGWDVAGLLSPEPFENGIKTGILAEDLRTGESLRLASVSCESPKDIPFGKCKFEPQTLTWDNHILVNSLPCNLLIIDEL
jgi:nucleoside-triphosphatase THEP1